MSKPSKRLSLIGLLLLSIIAIFTLVLLNNVRFDESLRALFNRDHGLYDQAMVERSHTYLLNVLPIIDSLKQPSAEEADLREEALAQIDLAYAYLNIGRYIERYACVNTSLNDLIVLRTDLEQGREQDFRYQTWTDIFRCYNEVYNNQDTLKANLIERTLLASRANQFWMNIGVIAVYALGVMLWYLLERQYRRGHKSEQEKVAWQSRAMTDHLTSTYNRMALHEHLERLVQEWPKPNESVGLVFYDIDHFKQFNDTFGHVAGDDALRKVADAVNSVLLSRAKQYRFGGEEFFIITRDAAHADVVKQADKILAAVQGLDFKNPNSATGVLTVSVGVYMMEQREYSVDELIKKVDDLLYVAKQHGRNRMVDENAGLVD